MAAFDGPLQRLVHDFLVGADVAVSARLPADAVQLVQLLLPARDDGVAFSDLQDVALRFLRWDAARFDEAFRWLESAGAVDVRRHDLGVDVRVAEDLRRWQRAEKPPARSAPAAAVSGSYAKASGTLL